MTRETDLLAAMKQSVLDGDETSARRLAKEGLDSGMKPLDTIEKGFVPGIHQAGELWESGDYFLPELVTAAQAMKAAMEVLQPALGAQAAAARRGKVVIGTVHGDIHDIGMTLVATMLSASGFEVSNEGADVPVERFVERARAIDADLVCASALLTTTMTVQRKLVTAVREAGLRARVMVGGAPVTREWAEQIGASGFADNAVAATDVAKGLVG